MLRRPPASDGEGRQGVHGSLQAFQATDSRSFGTPSASPSAGPVLGGLTTQTPSRRAALHFPAGSRSSMLRRLGQKDAHIPIKLWLVDHRDKATTTFLTEVSNL